MNRLNFLNIAPLLALFCGRVLASSSREIAGYSYGQQIPVTCLNRTIESGEHIKDNLGRLQYIPFPTCNETSLPLALRYGVTETISCTIDSLSDDLYHLLEYYVHSDAPLTCRVPTAPLTVSSSSGSGVKASSDDGSKDAGEYQVVSVDGDDGSRGGGGSGSAYTPLTIALQGTLQLSHLHIWTDMNVLMHHLSSVESPRKKSAGYGTPGYVVAGTAYSLPELHSKSETKLSKEEEDAAMIENARNPWTAGHGTKVIRGEPLTLNFRVSWVSGADSLGWLDRPAHLLPPQRTTVAGAFTKVVFFIMAAGIGALFASYYQKMRRNGGGWRGDGILGRPIKGRRGSTSGVVYGNGGRSNGYGGFSHANVSVSSGTGNGGYGYGGYGKND